jgi:hypothetical protein
MSLVHPRPEAIRPLTLADLTLDFNEANMLIFPEVLISAVVNAEMHDGKDNWGTKFVYQRSAHHGLKKDVAVMFPHEVADVANWQLAVGEVLATDADLNEELAEALAFELEGVKASTSPRIAAIPVTIATGLLQSTEGVTGSLNAENYALILDQLFRAGVGPSYSGASCGSLLIQSMRQKTDDDEMLRSIEIIVRQGILQSRVDSTIPLLPGEQVGTPKKFRTTTFPDWLAGNTPFSWFSDAWLKLTSQEWVSVLPPRRWVDWLATSARLGIGMGILCESRLLEEVGELILNNSDDLDIDSILSGIANDPLVQWEDSRKRLRLRNVQPDYRSLIARAAYVEKFLKQRVDESDISYSDEFSVAVGKLRTPQFRDVLRTELNRSHSDDPKKRARDAFESCLTARSLSGQYADHYGFLVQHGKGNSRFRVVDPSTEVLALIASLACGKPDGECSVGDVRSSLRKLGFQPSIPELVTRLENAGLCRDSADASDSVRVRSAFMRFQ